MNYHSTRSSHQIRIDLHVHCKERSACGKSSAEEQIRAARMTGLNAIAFTDHNRLMPEAELLEYNEKYAPFRILGGVEVDADDEHILVFGIRDSQLEKGMWSYPLLHRFVRKRGGFMALAHPFRYRDSINIDMERFPLDAIELASNNTPGAGKEKIREVASALGLPVLCNSDSHITTTIGEHYNFIDVVPANEAELIHLLKSGKFRCGKEG